MLRYVLVRAGGMWLLGGIACGPALVGPRPNWEVVIGDVLFCAIWTLAVVLAYWRRIRRWQQRRAARRLRLLRKPVDLVQCWKCQHKGAANTFELDTDSPQSVLCPRCGSPVTYVDWYPTPRERYTVAYRREGAA